VAHRKLDNALPVLQRETIGKQRNRLRRVLRHSREGRVEVFKRACREIRDTQAEPLRRFFGIGALEVLARMLG
jgi:phage-related protein